MSDFKVDVRWSQAFDLATDEGLSEQQATEFADLYADGYGADVYAALEEYKQLL